MNSAAGGLSSAQRTAVLLSVSPCWLGNMQVARFGAGMGRDTIGAGGVQGAADGMLGSGVCLTWQRGEHAAAWRDDHQRGPGGHAQVAPERHVAACKTCQFSTLLLHAPRS